MRVGILRRQCQRLLMMGDGILQPALGAHYDAESDKALGTIRPKRKSALIAGLRRIPISLRLQSTSEVIEAVAKIRPERQRFAIAADRLVKPAEILQRIAEIIM